MEGIMGVAVGWNKLHSPDRTVHSTFEFAYAAPFGEKIDDELVAVCNFTSAQQDPECQRQQLSDFYDICMIMVQIYCK